MVLNKQVNLWRGSDPPPTLYHIWFKDESLLLRYDEKEKKWIVFLDSTHIISIILEFMNLIDNISINGHSIIDSPVLNGADLLLGQDGHYVKKEDTLQQTTLKLDSLLTTKVYEL